MALRNVCLEINDSSCDKTFLLKAFQVVNIDAGLRLTQLTQTITALVLILYQQQRSCLVSQHFNLIINFPPECCLHFEHLGDFFGISTLRNQMVSTGPYYKPSLSVRQSVIHLDITVIGKQFKFSVFTSIYCLKTIKLNI